MMKRTAILLFLLAILPVSAFAQSYSAQLSGGTAVPGPGDPDGMGFAVISIDGNTLRYTIWAQNIGAPTGARIEDAAGNAVVVLDPNMLTNGSMVVASDVANRIRSNPSALFVELTNAEFTGGAVRGQLAGTASGDGAMTAYLPVVGKARGANDTNFVTDLRIVNNGSASARVTLDYFATSASGRTAPTSSQTVTVAPGEQKVLDDVTAFLGAPEGVGGLRITADQNVTASARIINDLRAQNRGTAGFAVEAEPAGYTSGTITFLAHGTDYRTNVGYFNPGSSSVAATFTARGSDGTILGTHTMTIPGFSMTQQSWSSLIPVPEGSRTQQDFYVTWTADAPLFVYGAVTDNRTGDAVLSR